jgi:uncharacterized protein YjeT (DUF2065 family)
MELLVTLVGLILILEAAPYAASPQSMQNWLRWVSRQHPGILRAFAVSAMVTGFLLCYLTQRTNFFG